MTKYKKEYGKNLEDFMRTGKSISAWTGLIGIDRDTFYKWKEKHPEFNLSAEIGYSHGIRYWEEKLIRLIDSDAKTAGAIFVLKTRFHREYGNYTEDGSLKDPAKEKAPTLTIVETFDQYIRRTREAEKEKEKERVA